MSDPLYLQVKVRPNAPKTQLTSTLDDGTLKVDLKAAPEKGAANQELCRFLSAHYKIPTDQVKLISGQNSRRKLLKIENQ